MSSGSYYLEPKCGFKHTDALVKDLKRGTLEPLVTYVCGCSGYCVCGNERKLREEK